MVISSLMKVLADLPDAKVEADASARDDVHLQASLRSGPFPDGMDLGKMSGSRAPGASVCDDVHLRASLHSGPQPF